MVHSLRLDGWHKCNLSKGLKHVRLQFLWRLSGYLVEEMVVALDEVYVLPVIVSWLTRLSIIILLCILMSQRSHSHARRRFRQSVASAVRDLRCDLFNDRSGSGRWRYSLVWRCIQVCRPSWDVELETRAVSSVDTLYWHSWWMKVGLTVESGRLREPFWEGSWLKLRWKRCDGTFLGSIEGIRVL